ncbi:hypothetical protein [Staphylothermus hellenicus]|nr:hypothetical protein [Staphylothermus hellenicus]
MTKDKRIEQAVVSWGAAVNTYMDKGLEDSLGEHDLKPSCLE